MFCEECGAKLESGMRFCENCGTPVPGDVNTDNLNRAEKTDNSNIANGVIITRVSVMAEQLCVSKDFVTKKIDEYIEARRACGVNYVLCDVMHSDVNSVVSELKKLTQSKKIKYVFILGNEYVINVAEWMNESSDSDKTVTSALPYSTLNTSSPWDGHEYRFDSVLRVGRLPSYNGESAERFFAYFQNVKQQIQTNSISSYGLSALVWKDESDNEYSKISYEETRSAPSVTVQNVEQTLPDNANLLYFNLHGSNETKFWYGQDDDDYPEAFEPKNLEILEKGYFIGVEACYGGKFMGNLTESDSIVIKAMQSGSIALLGSSKIAYGTPNPPGSCADFVVGEFLYQLKNGETAGDSHVLGIKALAEGSDEIDDTEIKTVAEFSLFGDPSVSLCCSHGEQNMKAAFSFC